MSIYAWIILTPFAMFAVYLAWLALDVTREWMWDAADLREDGGAS